MKSKIYESNLLGNTSTGKKTLTLVTLVCFFLSSFSQITYNISDVPTAGTTQRIAQDTFPLPSINFGNKGANQVYDFSNLVWYKYDTVEFRTPVSSQTSVCPNADVATTADGINFILTNTDNANNKLTLEGFQGQITAGNTLAAAYSTKPDLFRFPTNYLNTFGGTGYLYKRVTGAQVGQPLADSVELTINVLAYTDTIDGWGKVITPVGAYKCLRKQRKETTNTIIRAKTFFGWSTVSNTTSTTTRYTYITKEAKGSVINFNYDTANVLQSVNWSMVPPTAPVADFSFAVGANGLVTFTDLSDNYPTSWAWTFGDGGTSTQQNPTHTYSANGTYTVCLTATNAGGSSTQVCKQVVVNNVPVQPVANFSWANPSGGLVNFTDLSINSPTSWAWTFGDAGASAQQSPSHVYTANGTYNVCLTATNTAGSNQHCANVTVTGISIVNNAPVATDDTASVLQPDGVIINVGTNDLDPNGDNVCLTGVYGSPYFSIAPTGNCTSIQYTPDSAFCGSDSCYYIICDNGTPSLCDTGKFVVTSVCNPALLPVASMDTAQFVTCNYIVYRNTTLNYDSAQWVVSGSSSAGSIVPQFYGDTTAKITFPSTGLLHDNQYTICLKVFNQFGTDSICISGSDTCGVSGVSDLAVPYALLYPNPSNNFIQIDMSRSGDESIVNYVAIEIYNAVGEKVKTINERGKRNVAVSISDLSDGMYLATLLDGNAARKVLGRFTVSH